MDFDLYFGRFFGSQIDFFEELALPDFELQHSSCMAKIVIFPRENAIFYKIDSFALKWALMENKKKTAKNRFEIKLFFHIDFPWILEPTWMDFGLQVEALERVPPRPFFQSCVQEAPKRLQERPKGVLRVSISLPRGPQEGPRAIKTCPGHAQSASRGSLF